MNLRSSTKQDIEIIPDLIKERHSLITQKLRSEADVNKHNDKIILEIHKKLEELSIKYMCGCKLRIESANTFLEFDIETQRKGKVYLAGRIELPMKHLGTIDSYKDIKNYLREIEKTIRRIKLIFKEHIFPVKPFTSRCYMDLTNRYANI